MRHLVIPDTQVTPTSNTDHLVWAAKYCIGLQDPPDKIIFLGDHWDMESLCSYDEGKMSFEGRKYTADIRAGINAMSRFINIIERERLKRERLHMKRWNYELHFLIGNHENRINIAVEKDRKLEDLMSIADLELQRFAVHDFLEPVVIDGICYSHYFVSGVMGRPVSSARALVMRKHMSCVMGHVQDRDIVYAQKGDGTRITGLFAGIFYQEDQDYLNPQTNNSWRGIWLFNDVVDGSFDELPISMKYLKRKYG